MKRFALILVLLLGALSGCAQLDEALGVDDGRPVAVLPESVGDAIEKGSEHANRAFPGAGTALAGILTAAAILYRALRKKKKLITPEGDSVSETP